MPIVPMNQYITIYKKKVDATGKPVLDRNGFPSIEKEILIKCRVDEGSMVVKDRSLGTITDETIVSTARILINKLADIRYIDEIEYINELKEKIIKHPKEINVKRNASGKPLLTEVFI
jgi:hypothetical protein